MSARGVRIVVGEGPSTRRGLLRFVLDGEGFDVVAEAGTMAELARMMATHRPDVVVLDDGIGAAAVGMINEMSPNTKVVLVWPGAVMPIGGAARVEPSRVLQDLGPTIARLTGRPANAASRGAALIDRASSDPDMLRAMLLGGLSAIGDPVIEDREPAPVVILPLTPTIDHDELVLNVPDADLDDPDPSSDDRSKRTGVAAGVTGLAAGAGALAESEPAAAAAQAHDGPAAGATSLAARRRAMGAQSTLNRRLGNLALGGAAVASALVLALAFGNARLPVDVVKGLAPSATAAPGAPNQFPGNTGLDEPVQGGALEGTQSEQSTDLPSRDVTLAGGVSPEPAGPPGVGIDPGNIGPGGDDGGTPPDDGGGGGDDHGGGDSGDLDRGGGNDDGDNRGGRGGDGGDDDGSEDHDSGGGNDVDGGDHDNGGGNDDDDNPAHGNGGGPGDNNGGGNGNGNDGDGGGNGNGGHGDGNGAESETVNGEANGNGADQEDSVDRAVETSGDSVDEAEQPTEGSIDDGSIEQAEDAAEEPAGASDADPPIEEPASVPGDDLGETDAPPVP